MAVGDWKGVELIHYRCDKCGLRLEANDAARYIVKLEVYAAAEHIDLDREEQLAGTEGLQNIIKQLAQADPDEVEDRTYRQMRFDLCDPCRKTLLANPLGEQG